MYQTQLQLFCRTFPLIWGGQDGWKEEAGCCACGCDFHSPLLFPAIFLSSCDASTVHPLFLLGNCFYWMSTTNHGLYEVETAAAANGKILCSPQGRLTTLNKKRLENTTHDTTIYVSLHLKRVSKESDAITSSGGEYFHSL